MNINDDLFNDNDTEMLDAGLEEEEEEEEEEDEELTQAPNEAMEDDDDEEEEEDNDEDNDDDNDEDDDEDDDRDQRQDAEVDFDADAEGEGDGEGDGDGNGEGDGDEDDEDDEDNDDEDEDEDDGEDGEDGEDQDQDDDQEENNDEDEEEEEEDTQDAEDAEKDKKAKKSSSVEPEAENIREKLIYTATHANSFDIAPYVAIPYASPIHSIALSKGPKWLFTGGEDGFIRKYDFIGSIEGKLQLTVAQKHLLVDSISLAGLISSYWENEQPIYRDELSKSNAVSAPAKKKGAKSRKTIENENNYKNQQVSLTHYEPKLSPVYTLAVQKESLWLLSGLSSGGIALQSVRHSEGSIRHYFQHGNAPNQHNDAVSVVKLNQDENKFISGSWDRKILEWDLNNGSVVNEYKGATGQISNLEYRPATGIAIDPSIYENIEEEDNDNSEAAEAQANDNKNDDDLDSLFGSDDDEENNKEKDKQNDKEKEKSLDDDVETAKNEDLSTMKQELKQQQNESFPINTTVRDGNIFLSSSMDGAVNVWDARLPSSSNNVLRIPTPRNTPPWCMSSCWSIDGDYIYAGRRNSSVEEFSIKMPFSNVNGVRESVASKTMKFPQVSGPVSIVKPMLNNHHILCGSNDNIRLYDLRLYENSVNKNSKKSKIPFMIIPGHHGGVLSDLYIDPTCRFMVSASGNRGWNGVSTEMVLIYEVTIDS
ncbi:hypothetical protein PACTADRAFT_3481 [Pachysolen tannophilus NRRL Y-2460]|uniref:Transcription factor spt8 beta-propeller domain-containing protein n=1 Tax=Pachysolen tannophilus NRRL Y-2460 TaxID=669874 RepID=A0A1E4TS55_PACTA|nr:hypothetical protein PACTADRAFT_3481 [Pachysolen tannophilus NRRL Y-2460]